MDSIYSTVLIVHAYIDVTVFIILHSICLYVQCIIMYAMDSTVLTVYAHLCVTVLYYTVQYMCVCTIHNHVH